MESYTTANVSGKLNGKCKLNRTHCVQWVQ